MLLNMSYDKILWTSTNFTKYDLQWLLMLDFGEMRTLSERYTIFQCVRSGPKVNSVNPMGASLGPY